MTLGCLNTVAGISTSFCSRGSSAPNVWVGQEEPASWLIGTKALGSSCMTGWTLAVQWPTSLSGSATPAVAPAPQHCRRLWSDFRLLAGRGYDVEWFRETLKNNGIQIFAWIPGRKSRAKTIRQGKRRQRGRSRIETMFGRLKDWRRVTTRYDSCPKVFLSAVVLAAAVML